MQIFRSLERSLSSIWRRFRDKTLVLPDHQRKKVWDEAKMEAWWFKIKKGGTLSGVMTSYVLNDRVVNVAELQDPNTIWFLNDGAQRFYHTLINYNQYCDNDEFYHYLENSNVFEQQIIYDNEIEAIEEFVNLNAKGTVCTPYELTKGIFVGQLPNYTAWAPLFEKLNSGIERVLAKMGCKYEDPVKGRQTTHKRYRDNLSLFWKFCTKDKTRKSFRVAKAAVDHSRWDKEAELEILMANFLKEKGYSASLELLEQFLRYIENISSFYLQIWYELKPKMEAPSNVHLRWWFQVIIYANNIGVSEEIKRIFTTKLILHSGGRTSIFYCKDKEQYNCNTQLSNLTNLSTILRAIDCEPFFEPKSHRKKSKEILIPGVVHSHINSFSAFGDNKTLPENCLENAHRSARSMSDEEIARLEKLNDVNYRSPKGERLPY